jgi:hypothetical protein
VTHQEKDFGDFLEEAIIKLDGAIEFKKAEIRRLWERNDIRPALLFRQVDMCVAHIQGLERAKEILLGK